MARGSRARTMRPVRSPLRFPNTTPSWALSTCHVAVLMLALSCTADVGTVLSRLNEARRLTADLRVQFQKAADASNRAVMANTEQTSLALASEAEQASRTVDKDVAELGPLLRGLGFPTEIQVFSEFYVHYLDYQKLDRKVLTLVVENTNLKAQALSFHAADDQAVSFQNSLQSLAVSFPPKERCRVDLLATQSILALREIQVLYAPHIAEQDEAAMTRMEHSMLDSETKAREALGALEEGAPAQAASALDTARSALDRFKEITGEIVALSRRNTNVIALDLSLRQKPSLAAACDDRLRVLQDTLAQEGNRATR
jgi:hypothetical protein